MKIAVIGSRNYTNKTQIKNFMFRLKMEHKGIEIVSGGAKQGSDKYAKQYSLEFDIRYSEFPAYHEPHNIHCVKESFRYGKPYNVGHYHRRNKDLIEYSDKVVAFVTNSNRITNGTLSALRYAEKIQKKSIIFD